MSDSVSSVEVCAKCGRLTEWDKRLGGEPLCLVCWDALAEIESVAKAKKYESGRKRYLEHPERCREYSRLYRLRHRKELNSYHVRYCSRWRELIASRQRDYYRCHHEAELARARKRRERCKIPLRQ